MRFYLDEDLSQVVAQLARDMGIDVLSAQESGRRGLSDAEQMSFAVQERRCLVTVNCRDYIPFCREYAAQELPHFGVLCLSASIRAERFHTVAVALARYDREHPHGMDAYALDYLRRTDA